MKVLIATAVVLAGCGQKAECWEPPSTTPEAASELLRMLASPDPMIRASAHALKAERCIDRLASQYGRGRDAADVIARAVVRECQGDLEAQASLEVGQEYREEHVRAVLERAEGRATVLIVRDRAAKCF